jgi:hypothetical protein
VGLDLVPIPGSDHGPWLDLEEYSHGSGGLEYPQFMRLDLPPHRPPDHRSENMGSLFVGPN